MKSLAPLREALNALVTKPVPARLVPDGVYSTSELTEKQNAALQDHCAEFCVPSWATGIGTMDAADLIVGEAVANGNIEDKS